MSDEADLDELARRYLDLWQDQMTALAGDEEFARALQQMTAAMGAAATAGPAAWAAAWPGLTAGLRPPGATERESDGQGAAEDPGEGSGRDQGEDSGRDRGEDSGEAAHKRAAGRAGRGVAEAAAGAAAAAASSRGGDDVLEQLARRLAALEERIAELEGGARPGRRGAAKPARKRRS